MEIYLIRHTTPAIEKGICYGQSDINVTDSFTEENATIQAKLPKNKATFEIYSSPLKRCKILAETLASKIVYDKRLMEVNFGDWELQKWDNINKAALSKWMENFVTEIPQNGESYLQLSDRANAVFHEICNHNTNAKIIVTHAGVIRSIVSKILDIDLKDSFQIKIPYAHIIKIEYINQTYKITEGLHLEACNN